ncbi:MAG: phage tail tube protein [Peptostreptococcaceae bacterium]|jgi:hypothetical protein|nr:phage tail tube protein [Peptostreptococcaceae bacterium]
MNKLEGYRQILGTHGQMWWDNELVYEVESIEAKTTAVREKVTMAGSMDEDSKITGFKSEGNFKIKKVYSRGVKKIVDAWKEGKDIRSKLVVKLADPDSFGTERVVIDNIWFNEVVLAQFEMGKRLDRTYKFGFKLENVDFPDLIEVK